ncbi:MAG: lipopolysaccharide biosynthesis protein [Bacteroidaceae bacterium]|nr:lipopolysaccharide biosynthesis protein [Bacteroidaceae bacterium]
MSESLSQKTFSGLVWTFLETFSLQGFGFVQGIILARYLMPSDYGLIAMTGVFFAISYALVDAGFTSALIRNNGREDIDYSTVYVTNVVLSFLISVVLCFCASLIADFYHEPLLEQIVYVNALLMFLGSFIAVQGARMTIHLDFKRKSRINIVTTIITGLISIVLAILEFGVWSLIYPNFAMILIKGVLYWHYQHWFPGIKFSWDIYKKYFSYGSNLMLSSILNAIYANVYSLVIGKYYSAANLGYYSKGQGYAALPATTVSRMLLNVSFPILSKVQDDNNRLQVIYRKMIRTSAYIVFPIMMLVAVLARPLVVVLITEKWLNSVVYLQILCFAMMWDPINALNLNLLMVKGKSNLFLRLEIARKIIGVLVLCVTIPMGVLAMCYGQVVASLLFLVINTYYTGKLINVGFFRQMKDLFPTICYSFTMGGVVFLFISLIPTDYIQILIGVIVGVVFYLLLSKMLHSRDYYNMLELLAQNLPSKMKWVLSKM